MTLHLTLRPHLIGRSVRFFETAFPELTFPELTWRCQMSHSREKTGVLDNTGEIMKRRLLFAILLIIVLAIILKYGATG
jgi:hypothetical protein